MFEKTSLPKPVLFLLDFYLVIEYTLPNKRYWYFLRQITLTSQLLSVLYTIVSLIWVLISEKQGLVEFLYIFAMVCILSKTFCLWIFDIIYKKSLINVIESVSELQRTFWKYPQLDEIKTWTTFNNILTACYCFIGFSGFTSTPLQVIYLPGKYSYAWDEEPIIYFFLVYYFFTFLFAGLMNAANDTFYASVFYVTKIYFTSLIKEFNYNVQQVSKKTFGSDIEKNKELLKCFKDFVIKHSLILDHCSKLENVFLHYASLKVASSMLIMAMTANLMVLPGEKIKKFFAFIIMVIVFLILCFVTYFANELTEESSNLTENMFFILRDFNVDDEIKIYIRMILLRSRNPFQLTLSKMFQVNNDLLLSGINLTFSWYTILNTFLKPPEE